jgi:hypothetical protein
LLLRGFRLVLLQELLRRLCSHHGDLVGLLCSQMFLILFAWQHHTHGLFNLATVLKGHVLIDVRHRRRLDSLRLWVLANDLHDLGVLHRSHVHTEVSLMVLLHERLDRFARQNVLVLLHWVRRRLVVLYRHQLVGVLDTQHLNHLTVKKGQVIQLRCTLGQLQHCLVLHDFLRHGCGVGVGHRDNVHHVVVGTLD